MSHPNLTNAEINELIDGINQHRLRLPPAIILKLAGALVELREHRQQAQARLMRGRFLPLPGGRK